MNIKAQIYRRCEIVLNSTEEYENPFMDVNVDAVFTHEDGTVITLPGFWNGGNEWKVRFSAEKAGTWTYGITCTDKDNASLFDTGVIEASPCLKPRNNIEKHGYIRLEEGKPYMVHSDGTPFLYLGDTHWMMPDYERLHECNYPGCSCGNQFKHLADDRIKKGFTVYQTYFSMQRTSVSRSGTEGWWMQGSDYSVINPKAFNESMDIMIEYLTENGIVTALGFGTHYSTVRAMGQNVTAMKAFARYCVARYACYPIVWITAQEITNYNDNAFDCWKQVGAYVDELDGYHRPNGAHMHVHPVTEKRSIELDKEPWHQWWTLQGGHGGYLQLRNRYFYKGYYEHPTKPFIETENQYEDIYCSGFCGHDAPRIGAWHAMQSGSAGFTYGVTGIWVLSWNQQTEPFMVSYSPESWFTGMDKPGSEQITFLKKFYEYVGWYDLKPSFGFEFGNFDDRCHVSISHKDRDIIVYYFFSKVHEAGYLASLKANTRYQARWYDPVCGKFIDLPDIYTSDGTYPVPERPSSRDWVLLLNTYDLGEYEAWNYPDLIQPIPASAAVLGDEIKIVSIKASSEDPEHPVQNMLDGDPETYWQGFRPRTSQTITADFGESREVGYFSIESCMESLRFIEFRIFGSNDGENFELLTERIFTDVAISPKFNKYFDPIKGKYRYIKFFLNSTDAPNTGTQVRLTRFAVYEKGDPDIVYPLKEAVY